MHKSGHWRRDATASKLQSWYSKVRTNVRGRARNNMFVSVFKIHAMYCVNVFLKKLWLCTEEASSVVIWLKIPTNSPIVRGTHCIKLRNLCLQHFIFRLPNFRMLRPAVSYKYVVKCFIVFWILLFKEFAFRSIQILNKFRDMYICIRNIFHLHDILLVSFNA